VLSSFASLVLRNPLAGNRFAPIALVAREQARALRDARRLQPSHLLRLDDRIEQAPIIN
jgi:hypothetical protein